MFLIRSSSLLFGMLLIVYMGLMGLASSNAQPAASLFVDESGNIGVGTTTPKAAFHIQRSDGTAQMLIEDLNTSTTPRTLLKLANHGNTKFEILEKNSGNSFAFTYSGKDFRISRQNSGVVEFSLSNTGNLTISGTLTENSDRTTKTGIEVLDGREVLARLVELPISRWRRDNEPEVAHIGPMAQDFHALFDVGHDPKRIATIDTSGVALAAIQGLNTIMAEQLAEKNIEIEQLKERLAKLERMVTLLAGTRVPEEPLISDGESGLTIAATSRPIDRLSRDRCGSSLNCTAPETGAPPIAHRVRPGP